MGAPHRDWLWWRCRCRVPSAEPRGTECGRLSEMVRLRQTSPRAVVGSHLKVRAQRPVPVLVPVTATSGELTLHKVPARYDSICMWEGESQSLRRNSACNCCTGTGTHTPIHQQGGETSACHAPRCWHACSRYRARRALGTSATTGRAAPCWRRSALSRRFRRMSSVLWCDGRESIMVHAVLERRDSSVSYSFVYK